MRGALAVCERGAVRISIMYTHPSGIGWVLRLEHISGTYMLADLLTKAVSRPIFLQLMELLDAYARTGVSALHS